ncbi:MAG: Holliday junction resolvase RuvX [Polyangiaceae bacterium]|nr:Holliday junction resolvase RuvX [Polyangiaceae bacterium]
MRVAALDLGKVRVGLSVSDELGAMAHPRPALDARNRRTLLQRIKEIADDEGLTQFVIGLPIESSGEEGPAAQNAIIFAEQVAEHTGLPVTLWDERFTTTEATKLLRDGGHRSRGMKSRIDGAAACVILQAWMDRQTGNRRTADHRGGDRKKGRGS